jgi:hypothetical protein
MLQWLQLVIGNVAVRLKYKTLGILHIVNNWTVSSLPYVM